jgi:NADPH-dependent 7-cyano-7-deazaguanine reductase QueF-like protein
MATYLELFALQSDATLLQKITSALNIASVTIFEELVSTPGHDRRVLFAKTVVSNNGNTTVQLAMLKFLLGKFNTSTVAQIQAVTDAQIQTAVNNAIDLFATGF